MALIAPPSILIFAARANPIELPVAVPMLKVPCVILNNPVTVGEPFMPDDRSVGIVHPESAGCGNRISRGIEERIAKRAGAAILNVPFVIVRNPTALAPSTVSVPPGVNVNTGVLLVPLLRVTPAVCLRSVVLAPPRVKVASVAPVKVMPAPAVLALVLKSIVPLLVRSPAD